MFPYGRQEILEEDISVVAEALRANLITTGPLVELFEEKLSKYVGCPTFVVNSGTAALHAAYYGIGIGPSDEVITPPNTFIATQATAALFGAKIVFADIDLDTGLIDLENIGGLITKRTKAIVLVDYAGQPCDVEKVRNIIGNRDIKIVQDAAHSLGSSINEKMVGSLADITTFSFFATKNITTGEGGAVSSPDSQIFQKARDFARQGLVRDTARFVNQPDGDWYQEVQHFGLNYRLTDFQCALGISQLDKIQTFKNVRNTIFTKYTELLSGLTQIQTLKIPTASSPMWHLFPIRVKQDLRESLQKYLYNAGIGTQRNYIPAYWHPVFSNMNYKRGLCPKSEVFHQEEISLPMHTTLKEDELEFIARKIVDFFHSARE